MQSLSGIIFLSDQQSLPDEALVDLVRLVHCSPSGINKLVDTFQGHWKIKCGKEEGWSLPKCKIKSAIVSMATKETRPPNPRPVWHVHSDVLDRLGLAGEGLSPLSPMGCFSPPGKRVGKRSHGSATPTMKPLQYFLKKSPKDSNVARCLDLTESSTNECKRPKLVEEKTVGPVIVLDSDDNDLMDTKENIDPIDQSNDSKCQTEGNPGKVSSIDWTQQLLANQILNVPVDYHDV